MNLNGPHIHLLINHFPVIGSIIIFLVLLHGVFRKSHEVVRLSLMLWVFLSLVTIAVYLTGDPAARIVRHIPGVQKSFIEHHDNAATVSLTIMEILGASSLAGLWFFRADPEFPRWFVKSVAALSIVVIGFMSWTAYLGGEIRHTEIRPGFKLIIPPGPVPEK